MLAYTLKEILSNNIHKIVCERDIEISMLDIMPVHIDFVDDVRSATFYAFGLSQKTQEPVVLVVRESYISNILTGLTEAWFQRSCVIVVAVGNNILNSDLSFLKPCTKGIFKVRKREDYLEHTVDFFSINAPVVYLIEDVITENKESEKLDLTPLIKEMKPGDCIFADETICMKEKHESITMISSDDRYGMISEYMGYILSFQGKCCLVTSTTTIDLDMNIFNNRYMCAKFKLILVGKKLEDSQIQWIESNGVSVCRNTLFNEATCSDFLGSKEPSVWNLIRWED